MYRFTEEEQETHAHWDYAAGMLIIQTTKKALYQSLKKRALKLDRAKANDRFMWVSVPLEHARHPMMAIRSRAKAKQKPV